MSSFLGHHPEHAPNANGYCACQSCYTERRIRDLTERTEWQRQELSKQADEIKRLRRLVAEMHYRACTAEMKLAIAGGDESAWAKAIAERQAA